MTCVSPGVVFILFFFLYSREKMSPFLCIISAGDAGKPLHEQGWRWPSVSLGRSSMTPLISTPKTSPGSSWGPPAPTPHPPSLCREAPRAFSRRSGIKYWGRSADSACSGSAGWRVFSYLFN